MTLNPSLIQPGPSLGGRGMTPLVLFHDGGGTTISYHYLGELGRRVYGIEDPRFLSCRPWRGGIKEMSSVYANLIRSVVPSGNVILGGEYPSALGRVDAYKEDRLVFRWPGITGSCSNTTIFKSTEE